MKIQCDVCEKAQATVICCADEAALCTKCDVEVHAANKLASKHQRLHLQNSSDKLPPCDICQDKTAFIFCVEDRELFCKKCDEAIHSVNSLVANHQRFLAAGIRVALSSSCNTEEIKIQNEPKPPKSTNALKTPAQDVTDISSHSWGVDDFLQFSDYASSNKKEQVEFNEIDWLTDINFYGGQTPPKALVAAEVPQLREAQPSNMVSYRSNKYNTAQKKPRLQVPNHDNEEHFTVPDLGLKSEHVKFYPNCIQLY